ncbi:hypothetical protein IE53DRAFT_336451 [Violaceomyces palustris]|uniref:Uncharacterized protein n=1 Tax=Violaceomyces palustris TaxID=1673888 RepID=A0ACD0NLT8_9BASI|nr:hypothetical protein IE53DRAFT_336451 [Violaceomyces palustris]
MRGTTNDTRLTSLTQPPAGAIQMSIPIPGANGEIFTWYSKTPQDEAQAESAFVIIHGVRRDADRYFKIMNNVWAEARDDGLGSAKVNSIRVAPLFFSTNEDRGVYPPNSLAWGDSNAYTAGEASTNPEGSSVSSFTVLDMFLNRFSDQTKYPNMKFITFVAHGGGAQLLQRYAVLGQENPAEGRISVRYVVGDPSSMLYFTQDRPVAVDQKNCPDWDKYRYGLSSYSSDYPLPFGGSLPELFKRYAQRDVRYVVGLDDTSDTNGDQFCMARAVGGPHRKNRTLAYWKYIHLLSGSQPEAYRNFPGTFPALDKEDKKKKGSKPPPPSSSPQAQIPTSSESTLNSFRGITVSHNLATVTGAGHDAQDVLASGPGMHALFNDRNSASTGASPNLGNALNGITSLTTNP